MVLAVQKEPILDPLHHGPSWTVDDLEGLLHGWSRCHETPLSIWEDRLGFHAGQTVWAAFLCDADDLSAVNRLEGEVPFHSARQVLDLESRTIIRADGSNHATRGGERNRSRAVFVKGDVEGDSIRPRPEGNRNVTMTQECEEPNKAELLHNLRVTNLFSLGQVPRLPSTKDIEVDLLISPKSGEKMRMFGWNNDGS